MISEKHIEEVWKYLKNPEPSICGRQRQKWPCLFFAMTQQNS